MTYDATESISAEFHRTWQRWAPSCDAEHSDRQWHEMPESYRKTMRQTVRDMIARGFILPNHWDTP